MVTQANQRSKQSDRLPFDWDGVLIRGFFSCWYRQLGEVKIPLFFPLVASFVPSFSPSREPFADHKLKVPFIYLKQAVAEKETEKPSAPTVYYCPF